MIWRVRRSRELRTGICMLTMCICLSAYRRSMQYQMWLAISGEECDIGSEGLHGQKEKLHGRELLSERVFRVNGGDRSGCGM